MVRGKSNRTCLLGAGIWSRCFKKGVTVIAVVALCGSTLMAGGPSKPPDTFYKVEELSSDVGMYGGRFYTLAVFGPTGLKGWLLTDNLVVREVEPGSPADGVMEPADVITAANGHGLGDNPLKIFGEQIIASDATGVLKLTIMRSGKRMVKTLKIIKLPKQAQSWPFDCPKSKQVLANAAKYLAEQQRPNGGFDTAATIAYGMAGLVWLASDDPQYLHNCRNIIAWFEATDTVHDPDGTFAWGLGYGGIFLGEYYLKTGDQSVLPMLKAYGDRIVEVQDPRGGWTHGHPGGYGYVQGGLMNPAGAGCWLALELMHECGMDYPDALKRARKYFMRYVDRGTLPYGDQYCEFNGSGNSKDALACLALHVKGEKSAAELFGHIVTDFPEDRVKGHTGGMLGFGWGMVAGNLNPHRPDYRRLLDHWNWLFHVGRRWDGGFSFPGSVTGGTYLYHGSVANTGCVGMTFGVPNRCLRILGKGESVFGDVNLSSDLKKGLKLYQASDFEELRKVVDNKTEFGKQLLKAADAKEQDIAASLKAIKSALTKFDPIKAQLTAETLDAMCKGDLPACKELLAESKSDKYAPARKAAEAYEANRFLIFTEPESRKIMEKMAGDKKSGTYQTYAKKWLMIPSDAFSWVESSSLVFSKYWETKETDPLAMRMIKRLAAIQGGNWTSWFPNSHLRKEGYIKDTFVDEWSALLPASGLKEGKDATEFAYFAVAKEGAPPDAGWMQPDFDDRKWTKGKGPMSNARDSTFKPQRGAQLNFFRIPFKVDKTDYSEWKLYIHNKGYNPPAVVYLNGHCIAWVDKHLADYEPVDLPISALKYLKKGKNVLAVRTRRTDKEFDIGIYAKEGK